MTLANPVQEIPVVSDRTRQWISEAATRLYYELKANADSPLIEITFPSFAPEIICTRILNLVVARLEAEGYQMPSMIINATR